MYDAQQRRWTRVNYCRLGVFVLGSGPGMGLFERGAESVIGDVGINLRGLH